MSCAWSDSPGPGYKHLENTLLPFVGPEEITVSLGEKKEALGANEVPMVRPQGGLETSPAVEQ